MISTESEQHSLGRFVLHNHPTLILKRIEVYPKGRLSFNNLYKSAEVFATVKGNGTLTLDGVINDYKSEKMILISQCVKDHIEDKLIQKVVFDEAQRGTFFGEDHILKIEDDYKRN